ncbi:zinc metallopeptidase [Sulfuriroseicoccus oceanibius]|uniref:Zinc metallopeptidase n=1 Tax=Sulfuriroseicoccus oceanibius TaxID=2707525 RepID=A0A6B3LGT0_9BACT|nr:zinc metallopeptidase [Sulfuriroseicoccus oceanibius]QQL44398.1 zinc metallopeptidase [Sulfuriroseicoccus oceanibius]
MIILAVVLLLVYLAVTVGLGGMARSRFDAALSEPARGGKSSARLVCRALLNDAGLMKVGVIEGWFKGWSSYDDEKEHVVLSPRLIESASPGALALAALQAARAEVARKSPGSWRRRRQALRWSSALPGFGFVLGLLFLFARRLQPTAALWLIAAACAVGLFVFFVTLATDLRAVVIAKKSVADAKVFADSSDLELAQSVLDVAPLLDLRGPVASTRWLLLHALPMSKRS